MRIFCVYLLRAANEEKPFYVGKSYLGSGRLLAHYYLSSRKVRTYKQAKIKSLLDAEIQVIQEIIYTSESEQEAFDKEKELISFYGRKDTGTGILCNHTDGGEGFSGLTQSRLSGYTSRKPVSDETRKKMSEAKRGKSSPRKGVKLSQDTRERIRKAKSNISEETRQKMSKGQTGRKVSPETRKKMSDSAKAARRRRLNGVI